MTQPHSVEQIFAKLSERFKPEHAQGLDATYQFALTDAEPFYFQVRDQVMEAHWGEHDDPDITLRLTERVLSQVVSGDVDGMSAFLSGKLRAEGNLMLATHLGKLFRKS